MEQAKPIGATAPSSDAPEARLRGIGRLLTVISNWSLYLSGGGLVVMSLIVFWQVFCRYVLNWSNSWTAPAALLLMGWFIFLGAAVGVRENFHLGFDVLLYILPKGSKKVLRTLSDLVVSAFAIGMIVYGGQLVALGWPARMPALGIPDGTEYLPVVGGGILILLFSVERMVLRFAGVEVDHDVHLEDVPTADDVKDV